MVRFLIEHALPLNDKHFCATESGSALVHDAISVKTRDFAERGRFTDFNLAVQLQ